MTAEEIQQIRDEFKAGNTSDSLVERAIAGESIEWPGPWKGEWSDPYGVEQEDGGPISLLHSHRHENLNFDFVQWEGACWALSPIWDEDGRAPRPKCVRIEKVHQNPAGAEVIGHLRRLGLDTTFGTLDARRIGKREWVSAIKEVYWEWDAVELAQALAGLEPTPEGRSRAYKVLEELRRPGKATPHAA